MMLKGKSTIRLLFAAVILWQIPQYIITARFREPYPALSMPDFSGTLADRNGNIRLRNVKCKVLFQGGGLAWVSPHTLLSQAPDSHRALIMTHMFSPPAATPDQVPLRTLKAQLFPGWILSSIRGQEKGLDPQTKEWLKRRLQVLYPSATPQAITFVWYEDVFNVSQVPPVATQVPIGIREVGFE